jgi:hypothetical protein
MTSGKAHVVGHGQQQKQAAAQAIPVEHDVQGEKHGAEDIREDRHHTAGKQHARDAQRDQVADAQLAEHVRQGVGQVEAFQPAGQALAHGRLLIDEAAYLRGISAGIVRVMNSTLASISR